LYEEVLRRVQQKLASAGFYRGPIDGTYDAKTRKAMQAYQTSVNLQPTGFPDQATLWRLLHGGS
jgi:peptidoglycan hydrolase-like protein with peptidoglycan-binding domain